MQILHILSTLLAASLLFVTSLTVESTHPDPLLEQRESNNIEESVAEDPPVADLAHLVPSRFRYAVIVDCGSTGTRAHLYRWLSELGDGVQAAYAIEPLRDHSAGDEELVLKIRPGLSSVSGNPDLASDHMRPLMEFASRHIPDRAQAETPVHFIGTAGMRGLTHEKQNEILADIIKDLKREFKFSNLRAQVIDGETEGTYVWTSVNAISQRLSLDSMQKFESPPPPPPPLSSNSHQTATWRRPQDRRYGLIEVGGASAQVVFPVDAATDKWVTRLLAAFPESLRAYERHLNDLVIDTRDNRQVKLFSVSFLGFGINSARELHVDLLVREAITQPGRFPGYRRLLRPLFYWAGATFQVEDPCLPLGAVEVVKKPLDLLRDQSKTVGFVADDAQSSSTFNVRLVGNGNYLRCRQILTRVIRTAKREHLNCKPLSCPMDLVGSHFVPFQHVEFLGAGDLYYTTRGNAMMDKTPSLSGGRLNLPMTTLRAREVCSTPKNQMIADFPSLNQSDPERISLQCFKLTWTLTWLATALMMPTISLGHLKTVNKLGNNRNVDLSQGAIMNKLLAGDL